MCSTNEWYYTYGRGGVDKLVKTSIECFAGPNISDKQFEQNWAFWKGETKQRFDLHYSTEIRRKMLEGYAVAAVRRRLGIR